MQIDSFIDKDEFKNQIDDWIEVFRNTKPASGTNGPLIPRDPEREAEAIRSKEGIPLIKPVVDDLLGGDFALDRVTRLDYRVPSSGSFVVAFQNGNTRRKIPLVKFSWILRGLTVNCRAREDFARRQR